MQDVRTGRISRELFVAAIGENLGVVEPWVMGRLSAILEEEEVAAGDVIYAAGDAPEFFYFVRQGRVELLGEEGAVEVVDGPRSFGMLDTLVERPRSHTARASVPLVLLRVRMDAWLELLEDSFALARMAVLRAASSVAALEERLWSSGRALPTSGPPLLESPPAPLDVVDRLAVLLQTPPLRGAGAQPVSDLALVCDEVTFAAGERMSERGTPMDSVFVLIEGRVEATRKDPDARWTGGPGQVVCGAASFVENSSAWEAHAVVATRALAFSLDDWFDVMEENFEMVRATLASLALEHQQVREALEAGAPSLEP